MLFFFLPLVLFDGNIVTLHFYASLLWQRNSFFEDDVSVWCVYLCNGIKQHSGASQVCSDGCIRKGWSTQMDRKHIICIGGVCIILYAPIFEYAHVYSQKFTCTLWHLCVWIYVNTKHFTKVIVLSKALGEGMALKLPFFPFRF